MNPIKCSLSAALANPNNIALSQVPVSGTALTLNGSAVSGGVATLDVPRRIALTFGLEVAPRTLLVSGTNRFNIAISETLNVPTTGGSTIATQQDFATVTSALPGGGGWTQAANLGTSAIASTPWIEREWGQLGKMGVLVSIPTGSAAVVNLEVTFDDIQAAVGVTTPYNSSIEPLSAVPPLAVIAPASETVFNPLTVAAISTGWLKLAAATNGGVGAFDVPVLAIRLTTDSTSGAGTAVLYMIETTSDRKSAF